MLFKTFTSLDIFILISDTQFLFLGTPLKPPLSQVFLCAYSFHLPSAGLTKFKGNCQWFGNVFQCTLNTTHC